MSDEASIPIYTIGYGNRALGEFLGLLQRYEVKYLIDVRSAPYSRFRPEFAKAALAAALAGAEIRYLFLGESLGGRPADADCYTEGRVDYEKVKQKEFYRQGVERLQKAFEQRQRIALMCSEVKPSQCHRCRLIGASLDALSIPVMHIDEEGGLQSQGEVMAVITRGQLHLFGGPALGSRKRYKTADPNEEKGIDNDL